MTFKKVNAIEYTIPPRPFTGNIVNTAYHPLGESYSTWTAGDLIRLSAAADRVEIPFDLPVNLTAVYLDLWVKCSTTGAQSFRIYCNNYGNTEAQAAWNIKNNVLVEYTTVTAYVPILVSISLGDLVAGRLFVKLTTGSTDVTLLHAYRLRWS